MNLIDKIYPHPVLRPGSDDASGNISFDIKQCECRKNYVYIDYSVVIENPTLEKMLEEKRAKTSIWIECQASFYRELHQIDCLSGCVRISSDYLRGRIELIFIVSAVLDIPNYKNSSQHADYNGMTFAVYRGDILAVSDTKAFYVDEKYDSLANIHSFIVVKKSDSVDHGSVEYDFNGDNIILTLPKITYDGYETLRNLKSYNVAMSVIIFLPVLVDILNEWKHSGESFEEQNSRHLWFRAVKSKLVSLGINISDESHEAFEIAQAIFEYPYDRALNNLNSGSDTQEADE